MIGQRISLGLVLCLASATPLACGSSGSSEAEGHSEGAGGGPDDGGGGAGSGGVTRGSGGTMFAGGGTMNMGGAGEIVDQVEPPVPTLPECDVGCLQDCVQGCFDFGPCEAGTLQLSIHRNAHTLGVVWEEDVEFPRGAQVTYRPMGFETWFLAHPAAALGDGRAATSLFFLSSDTEYEVRVQGASAVSCESTKTKPSLPRHETNEEVYVDAGAQDGGDGTEGSPFSSISEALSQAGPGTDVIIQAGIYRESLTIDASGTEGAFIRLLGEPGAILDGSLDSPGLTWTADGENVWSTPWEGDPQYLLREGERMYHLLSVDGVRDGIGDDDEVIEEGYFVEGGQLYVRSSNDPSGGEFQIPVLNTAIALSGVEYVWVSGLTIRYFGEGDYAKGVDVRGSSHVVVEGNVIHDIPSPVWSRGESNDLWVVDNEIYQTRRGQWSWAAVKGTDHENSALTLAGGAGAIVRNNSIHDLFNGVYSGSFDDAMNMSLAYDVDVYQNRLLRIFDDGFEPEGAVVNNRFWLNTLDVLHNGISLAPVTEGPVWVLRNRFTDFEESSFKVSNDSSGEVFLYHNSAFTGRPDTNGMGQSGYFENMVFRNNIVQGTKYGIEMSQDHGQSSLDFNNWYASDGAPHIKWDNVRYDDSAAFCAAVEMECNGHNEPPGFENPEAAKLSLTSGSPNIDSGERIYGVNDVFVGNAPDIGYLEFGDDEVPRED